MQESEMRALGISTRDMSKFIALIYWVINTNAYKLLFWMISFLLQDQNLVRQVTEELHATFQTDGSLDVAALQTQTPYLTALWHETLRVCNSSASARFVTTDTDIGAYTLKAGRRLLIPYRQLHLNKAIFGENAAEFDVTRFLKDSKLAQNPSYRPFGGGVTYCPGRFLAKQEIFMALAFLLCRNDISLSPLGTTGDQVSFDRTSNV
jgi:cytochrome P450